MKRERPDYALSVRNTLKNKNAGRAEERQSVKKDTAANTPGAQLGRGYWLHTRTNSYQIKLTSNEEKHYFLKKKTTSQELNNN